MTRPLRPLFDKHFLAETVVQATVLSSDLVNGPDVAAMTGASAALLLSDIPFTTPIAGARIGYIDDQFVVNPVPSALETSALDLLIAGSKDAILMVEGEANQLSEALMVDAILFGHEAIQPLLAVQEELARECGQPKRIVVPPEENEELQARVEKIALPKVRKALRTKDKLERYAMMDTIGTEVVEALGMEDGDEKQEIEQVLAALKKREMRSRILDNGIRIDGRSLTDIREITCETGILPRAHGSALFTRGETQALVITTLGTKEDEQMIDALDGISYKNFLLHYNFPAFSVGEARPPRAPGRREIGHGFLAEKGVIPILPERERISLYDSRGFRNIGIQRLFFHGNRLWRFPGHDGCRRTVASGHGGDCHGVDP